MQARQFIDNTRYEHYTSSQANFEALNSQREAAKQKKERGVKVAATLALVAIFVMALAYTSIGAKITACGYEVNTLKMDIASAEYENARLLLDVESLSSAHRIQQYAKEELAENFRAHSAKLRVAEKL